MTSQWRLQGKKGVGGGWGGQRARQPQARTPEEGKKGRNVSFRTRFLIIAVASFYCGA